MFTHHADLLEGKEVTQGLGEAGFEFLFPETKSPPPPPAPPPPSLCPLFWEPRREGFSAVPLRPGDHLLAVGLRVCERESEGQRKASCLWGLTAREYIVIARASDISARRPRARSPEGWFACMVMGHVAGSTSCFPLGCGQLLSQGNTSHSGI